MDFVVLLPECATGSKRSGSSGRVAVDDVLERLGTPRPPVIAVIAVIRLYRPAL
jgi:hypothetical protein